MPMGNAARKSEKFGSWRALANGSRVNIVRRIVGDRGAMAWWLR